MADTRMRRLDLDNLERCFAMDYEDVLSWKLCVALAVYFLPLWIFGGIILLS